MSLQSEMNVDPKEKRVWVLRAGIVAILLAVLAMLLGAGVTATVFAIPALILILQLTQVFERFAV